MGFMIQVLVLRIALGGFGFNKKNSGFGKRIFIFSKQWVFPLGFSLGFSFSPKVGLFKSFREAWDEKALAYGWMAIVVSFI